MEKMFCLSGKGSRITCDMFPPYDVSNGEYVIGLVDLSTFNSIPNVETGVNDKFYYGKEGNSITIEEGSYEIEDLSNYIQGRLPNGLHLRLEANNNTLKTEIRCNEVIDFTKEKTIAPILGFTKKMLEPNKTHSSDAPVNILKVNSIRVECNIVRGSFDNGVESHVIHEFFPQVEPGYKIVESPGTVIYLPLNVQKVHTITIELKDQDNRPVNLRGEILSVRLHIKKVGNGSGI